MSFWQRAKVMLGLADDFDDEYDEYDDREDAGEQARPTGRGYDGVYNEPLSIRRVAREPDVGRARDAGPPLRSVSNWDSGSPSAAGAAPPQVKMHIAEPRSFSEAQAIADRFKKGTPVIMNLTHTDAELAKRMLDFASGLTYAVDGGLQKVSDRVFMLTPANVEVSAEDRRRLRDKGLFSLDS